MPFVDNIGDVNVCESKIEWKIPDFLSLSAKEVGSYYHSPTFHVSNKSFHLRLYPAGDTKTESGFISLYVVIENNSSCYVTFTLSIKKSDGTLIKTETSSIKKIKSDWGYKMFCKKSLLQEKYLTILCSLEVIPDEKEDIVKEKHLQDDKAVNLGHRQLKELDELSQNLKNLFAHKDSCDVILQLPNKELKAHRAILIARSSVFAAMFQHDTSEKQSGFIDVPDCDTDSFPQFLEYLYSGFLENISFDSAFHLYSTSIKYDVQKLKEFCTEYLIENLTADNVCEIILLAEKYDDMKLLKETENFFIENFSKIVLTAEWVNLLKNDYRLANKFLVELSKTTASKIE